MKCLFTQSQVVEREMCEVSRVLWQDQQASWQGVPHVLVPRYVREHAVLYDLRGQRKKDTAGCQEQSEWRWGGVFRLHCEVAVCSSRISPAPHSLVFLLSCWMSVSELKCKLRRSSRPDTLAFSSNSLVKCSLYFPLYANRRCPRSSNPVLSEGLCLTDLRLTAQLSPMGRRFPSACCMYISSLSPTSRNLSFIISSINPRHLGAARLAFVNIRVQSLGASLCDFFRFRRG